MRKYHRWFSFPLIVFLFAVTVTGLYLQVVEFIAETETKDERPTTRTAPSEDDVQRDLAQSMDLAMKSHAGFPVQKIEISYSDDGKEVKLLTNKRIGPSVTVKPETGEVSYVERPKRTLRTIFILLHSGKFFGPIGIFIILLAGIALTVLSVTGLWVYIEMYRRRLKAKKTGFFWS